MLTPEQARAALEERQVVDDRQRQLLQTIGELPERLRVIAYGLMGRDAAGRTFQSTGSALYSADYYQRQHAAQSEAIERLDALSSGERVTLFGAFFPLSGGWRAGAAELERRADTARHGCQPAHRPSARPLPLGRVESMAARVLSRRAHPAVPADLS